MILFLAMLDSEEEKNKFSLIYEKYRYFLWYLANERLRDAWLAEDAVQEAFLALTRHMDKVGEVESPATRNFLATIVKNKAVDMIRRQKGVTEEAFTEREDGETQEDLLDAFLVRENYERILSAVAQLDEIYRVVFEYKYLHELSDREIADLLRVSPKTVNVRIFRARKKLQGLLAE
ncbi:MAG: RNA polymerase sigma factor [Clostridiales bacterium]|nr:RNA polymerase sigma factor [Clostridiales bacterium]